MLTFDRSVMMVGLGSLGHPLLIDGIHLRWQAEREIGFPWYGYYLLRRRHRPGTYLCLGSDLEAMGVERMTAPGRTLSLPNGRISSDAPLILADDFPAPGVPEVRLDSGSYLQVECPEPARKVRVVVGFREEAGVRLVALSDKVMLGRVTLKGKAGQVVEHEFEYDLITAVRLEAAPASLIDFCHVPVSQEATTGWALLRDFPYPMGLPVTHPNYPCTGNRPQDSAASKTEAMSRLRYPAPAGLDYSQLYEQLITLVQNGPGGPAMGDISNTYTGVPDAGDTAPPPAMPALYSLDLVLLAALHPAIAQMVGLYWADQTATKDEQYDYLILMDSSQKRLNPESVGEYLDDPGTALPGYICFNLKLGPVPDLKPAGWVDGYALTGMTVKSSAGAWVNAVNNAGLRWDYGMDLSSGMLRPDIAVLWWLHRAKCGDGETPATPVSGDYLPTTGNPIIVASDDAVDPDTEWPPGWPAFRMHSIDRALPDGWYSYRVRGQDLFGRQSELSPASRWKKADGATVIHPFAVQLTDNTPPPTPKGLEGWAVQPDDPLALKDVLWTSWQATLSAPEKKNVIGLRVRWEWPQEFEEQAPDTKEFRIYYEPGLLNARPGRTAGVVNGGATSTVTTDISHSEAANAFAGCTLSIRNAFYTIIASSAASPLVLTVQNLSGSAEDAVPAALAPCTISISPGHALWKDFRRTATWSDHFYTTACVPGRRVYELLLPQKGDTDRSGLPLHPSLTTPIDYAHVAVTAVDAKRNESAPSTPARVFAVNRTKPDAVKVVYDDNPLYATRADYHSHSYYTHTWPWRSGLWYHVLRALDQSVFQADWSIRSAGGRTPLTGSESAYFPSELDEPAWDSGRRSTVAAEINAIAAKADYAGLSRHGVRVLANLPGCERAFAQLTVQALDPNDPANRAATDSTKLSYTDTLDGRSQNRYLYRVLAVDGAQNRGDISMSSPPVHLYDIVPPRAPVLTRILGDERKVKLRWAANREPDLAEYRVYRTEEESRSRDIRLMEQLTLTVPETQPNPLLRAGAVEYADTTALAARTYYYRIVAVDIAGNLSAPSAVMSGRAVDTAPPTPPAFTVTEWQEHGGLLGIHLEWAAPATGVQVLVQRREEKGADWSAVSSWIPSGTAGYDDTKARPYQSYVYRLRVKSAAGVLNTTYSEASAKALFAQS